MNDSWLQVQLSTLTSRRTETIVSPSWEAMCQELLASGSVMLTVTRTEWRLNSDWRLPATTRQ